MTHLPKRQTFGVTIRFPRVQSLPAIVTRVRRLFDVGADIETIDAHLSNDPLLAPPRGAAARFARAGGWDGFELAVRAILGQQITVAAARRLAEQLVAETGEAVAPEDRVHPGLTHVFPHGQAPGRGEVGRIAHAGRAQGIVASLAQAAAADPSLFHPFGTIEEAIGRLRAIRGVGEWTAQYIALRALRETDAFPATDIGLLRGAARIDAMRLSPARLLHRAESWRPWRAYAAQRLWAAAAAPQSAAPQSEP